MFSSSLPSLIFLDTCFYTGRDLELCSSILAKLDIKPQERRANCFSLPGNNLEETRNKMQFSTLIACKLEHCMGGGVLGKHHELPRKKEDKINLQKNLKKIRNINPFETKRWC